jgi:hypothetical protein
MKPYCRHSRAVKNRGRRHEAFGVRVQRRHLRQVVVNVKADAKSTYGQNLALGLPLRGAKFLAGTTAFNAPLTG